MSARDVIARALLDLSPGAAHWDDQYPSVQRRKREEAGAILSALAAAGLVVVPREPTEASIRAAARLDWNAQIDPTWREFYRVMIDAALPTPPQEANDDRR